MSRNKEKAQSLLNRYHALKEKEAGVLESNPNLRPKMVQQETLLPQAERWRQTILSEILTKLTQINDPSLNEIEVRETNASLNKLHREQRAWEHHIKQLGGNDHIRYGPKTRGKLVGGTWYYGRAQELPEASVESVPKASNSRPSLAYYGALDSEYKLIWGGNHVSSDIPDEAAVEQWLVEKKRRELLAQLGV